MFLRKYCILFLGMAELLVSSSTVTGNDVPKKCVLCTAIFAEQSLHLRTRRL